MNEIIRVLIPRLILGALALIAAGSLSASTLCTTVGPTLNDFIGGSCTIGNYGFTFPSSGAYTSPVPATSVDVAIVGDGLTPGGQTGFVFTSTWAATGGFSNVDFNFDVSMAGLYYINSATLSLGVDISNPDGEGDFVVGDETLGGTGGGQIALTIYGNDSSASAGYGGGTALSGTAYVFGQSFALSKDINVAAFDDSSTTTVNSVTETFTDGTVPEPGPFVLTAGALGLLFVLRQRKHLLHLLGLALLVVVFSAGSAHAAPLCTSLSDNLQALISAGSCTIGDVLFGFTGSSYQTTGNAQSVDTASQVTFGVDDTAGGQIGFYMVPVVTGFYAGSPVNETLTISFTAQASLEPILGAYGSYTGQSLTEAQLNAQNGASEIVTTPPGNDPLNLLGSGSASSTFASSIAAGTVLTFTDTFDLSASSAGVITHMSAAEMDVLEPASVPEPVTMVLTGSSLLGLAFYLRRKRRRI
jgi:hypothetical protein